MRSSHPRAHSARRWFASVAVLGSIVATAAAIVAGAPTAEPEYAALGPPLSPSEVAPLPGSVDRFVGWNGQTFIQDNLWTTGSLQYTLWVTPDGRPIIGRRVLGNSRWSTYDLSKIKRNPLRTPTERDNHNVYAIGVDAKGFLHVVGNMHADPLRYVRSRRPGDIKSWRTQRMIGTQESSVTYPTFARISGGSLLFVYRSGDSGDGDLYANILEPNAKGWVRVGKIVDGRASRESPYPQRLAVDNRGNLHLMVTWRGTSNPATTNDVSYGRSGDRGQSWITASGHPLPEPLSHSESDLALDTRPAGSGLINSGGLAVDSSGNPHGVVLFASGRRSVVHHVWFDGSGWHDDLVAMPGAVAGRASIVTTVRGSVYVLGFVLFQNQRTLVLVDVTPRRSNRKGAVLATIPRGQWEPVFDTQALAVRQWLSLLVPTGTNGAEVVTYDLARLDTG